MNLRTAGEEAEILQGLKDIRDTFYRSPLIIYRKGENLDVFQEDMNDSTFYKYSLMCMAEYVTKDKPEESLQGTWNYNRVMCTMLFIDANEVGLINDALQFLLVPEEDYIFVKDRLYKVEDIYFDGPWTVQPSGLVIKGKLIPKPPFDFANAIEPPPISEGAFSDGFSDGFLI